MNTLYALFLLPKPENTASPDARSAWIEAVQHLSATYATNEEFQKVSSDLWQVGLQNGLTVLAQAIDAAVSREVPYQVLFLESEPNWIKG